MKNLILLSLFLCGCSAAYRQRKAIEKQHQLNYQYQNELAKDCVRLFPVKDSVGTPIISKSNNIDYSHGIDSLKNYIDSAKRFYDPLFSISDDTGKLRRTVLLQASQLNVLSSKINALKSAYKPCKPDTIKIPYYRVDDAKVNALQYALKIKSDSLNKVNALKSKSQKEINTWRWAAIIAILIIFGFVVIKVYALFNGGWVKKLIPILLVFMAFGLKAQNIDATYVKALEAKYPTVKSNFCKSCKLWVNPYFKAIVDTVQRESVVTYGYFDRHKDSLVTALKVPRTGIYASWHPADGFQNEDKFYNDINKGISASTDKYAKGHYCAWILCAWSVDGAILSNTYDFNEGIEVQAQNEGTELQVEFLTRALVGNKSAAAKMHYTGAIYDKVDFWKGSWGSKQVFNVDGISKNYSAVYWNLIKYGNQVHAYWFPNDNTATAKVGYQHYEIPVNDLMKRLGFDPQKTLN